MKKMSLLAAVVLSAAVGHAGAQALTYPTRNITVVIPKNPGGGTDTSARTLVEFTKNQLPKGVMFVPENKPAGNGVAGLIEVAKSKPDGYKLVMTTVELAMFPHEGKSPVTYADFTPIVTPIADPCSLVVKADAPYKTLNEFLDAAKSNPGKIKVGNSGVGAIYHLAALNIERKLGVKFNNVPYNEGIGPAIGALVGGHLDAVITTPGTAKSQVDAGALRILGVMDSQRFELFPNVPTFKEALGQEFDLKMRAWAVLAAPAKLPQKVADELITAFGKTVNSPEYQAAMKKQGIMPIVMLGKNAEMMMKEDHETYKELIAEAKKK
jgi:tripartite-type tricarboxylate transporter receptor subunit TctC